MEFKTPQDHREWIINQFKNDFRPKYDDGQDRHGGRLYYKPPFNMLKEELLDFVSYFYTLQWQMDHAIQTLQEAIAEEDWTSAQKALNILRMGNEEGRKEEDR